MRALQLLLVTVAAVALSTASAFAIGHIGNPASLDAEASVQVIQPIELTEVGEGLNFAKVVRPAPGDPAVAVTVNPDGTFTPVPFVLLGDPTAATFTIAADASTPVTVSSSNESCPAGLTLDTSVGPVAAGSFGVGGTLTVADSAADGVQTCSYVVSAQYM